MKRFGCLVLLAALCCLPGCAGLNKITDSDLKDANRLVRERKFSEAVVTYGKIAKESAGTERGAQALFAEACTIAYYDNPNRDYAQALQKFDEFLRRYPDNRKAREAQNWRSLVKTVVELRKENERLTQNIEQLKKIDIKHEERRRK
jgi:outer membrane protein assembly factor BamD (BamD/ComL family)